VALLLPALGLAADNPAFDDPQSVFYAARRGNLKQVQSLVEANPDLLDAVDLIQRTPLLYAAKAGHKEVVAYLLGKGSKAAYRCDSYGHTPVHWAAMYAKTDVVKLLAESEINLNCRDEEGRTPLHYAMGNIYSSSLVPHDKTVELLISLGADVNAQDDRGFAPITMGALLVGHKPAIEALLAKSAKENVNIQDKEGATPLHHAAAWGRADVIALLLSNGADQSLKRNDGKTAMDVANECAVPAKRLDVLRALKGVEQP
jgi:cytohesin